MAHRFITSLRKADVILKSGLFTGNFNNLAQPKRLELVQFLSQLSANPPPNPPQGFDKPSSPKEGNKNAAFTADGSRADPKPSPSSGDGNDREGNEEKSNGGPSPGDKKKRQIFVAIGIVGILGVCCCVYFRQNLKGFWDNFLDGDTVENSEMERDVETIDYAAVCDFIIVVLACLVWYLEAWK